MKKRSLIGRRKMRMSSMERQKMRMRENRRVTRLS
jgi:hypothetical protein